MFFAELWCNFGRVRVHLMVRVVEELIRIVVSWFPLVEGGGNPGVWVVVVRGVVGRVGMMVRLY